MNIFLAYVFFPRLIVNHSSNVIDKIISQIILIILDMIFYNPINKVIKPRELNNRQW